MANLQQLHSTLLAEFSKNPKNPNTIEQILNQLREALGNSQSQDAAALDVMYKDVFEITALLAVLKADMNTFENAILQVLSFYEVAPLDQQNKHLMLGLHLMFLLASKDRLSDFHMVLEKIPQSEQLNNAFIATPVKLEQCLMEGSYNKVVLTEKNIPSPFYTIFIRIMMDAVRENIAYSIEKSFKQLSISAATTMLLFDNQAQTAEFASQHKWKTEGNAFVFEVAAAAPEKPSLEATRIAQQMIYYAKQLEMIV